MAVDPKTSVTIAENGRVWGQSSQRGKQCADSEAMLDAVKLLYARAGGVTSCVVIFVDFHAFVCPLGAPLTSTGRLPLVMSNWHRARLLASLPTSPSFHLHTLPSPHRDVALGRRWSHDDNYRRSEWSIEIPHVPFLWLHHYDVIGICV